MSAGPAPAAAPAPPPSAPPAPGALVPGSRPEKEALIRKALKKIYDPEIPMNILDLGLIYGYEWVDDDHLTIKMTMTGPGCPVAGILAEDVRSQSQQASGVKEVKVEVVWEPPWGPEKMSDFAKRQFGYL